MRLPVKDYFGLSASSTSLSSGLRKSCQFSVNGRGDERKQKMWLIADLMGIAAALDLNFLAGLPFARKICGLPDNSSQNLICRAKPA
jgi:hypothetical protein